MARARTLGSLLALLAGTLIATALAATAATARSEAASPAPSAAAPAPADAASSAPRAATPPASSAPRAATPPATPEHVREQAAAIARAWIPSIRADGTIREPLATKQTPFPAGYGELMLAGVLAAQARRSGDAVVGAAASKIAGAATRGKRPTDPFNLLAGASLQHTLDRGHVPGFATSFGAWINAYGPFKHDGKNGGACLARPGCYTNWRLVWAAGAADLLASGAGGPAGSLLGDRSATVRRLQENIVLAVRNAAAVVTTPHGPARNISDPSGRSPSYHVLSAYLLDRVAAAAPQLGTPEASSLRDEAARLALTLMAPDGQLSWAGRSLDQSWVMAAAAALGARRAAAGDPLAPVWRTFADRALQRLDARYRPYADATLPIVPGLRTRRTASIIDPYAGVVQYNGLTAWLLADAAAHWPDVDAPRSALPSDAELLASDLPASGLIWGRSGDVFWSFTGRSPDQTDARGARGLTLVKQRQSRGAAAPSSPWSDLLALRPRERPLTTWLLYRRGRPASLQIDSVRGTGGSAVLRGRWRQRGRTIRAATIRVRVTGRRLHLSTAVRAGETLSLTVYTPKRSGSLRARGPGAQIRSGRCTLSASGHACPRTAHFRGTGSARLQIG